MIPSREMVSVAARKTLPSEMSEKCSEGKEGSAESSGRSLQVARQGRELQRYTRNGRRLVVGYFLPLLPHFVLREISILMLFEREFRCIPYKFKADESLEVLVISSQKGQAILFPKVIGQLSISL